MIYFLDVKIGNLMSQVWIVFIVSERFSFLSYDSTRQCYYKVGPHSFDIF